MDKVKPPLLIKKGAEANLYLTEWHNRKVIMKKRLPKKYRPPMLDEQIRFYRTIHEPQLMHEAKKAGVSTPTIFLVDVKNATIIMDYINGKQVKLVLSSFSKAKRRKLCFKIGELIGKLHGHGVVHGDLTTSNMILNSEGKIFFVDFGLGEKTRELEARGVDLHLMKRALQSAHFRLADECFNAVVEGYSNVVGGEMVKSVLDKIREIETRGRYVAERKGE
ncbi:MAG: KEOPS complex kinase/ATPase Bud32 [Candidatus Bathyarchaeia archaeon]